MQHADPTESEIRTLATNHLRISKVSQEASGPQYMGDCPCCGKKNKFYMNAGSGLWDCKVCFESGNFWTLSSKLGIRIRDNTKPGIVRAAVLAPSVFGDKSEQSRTPPKLSNAKGHSVGLANEQCMALNDPDDAVGALVKKYLIGRGFNSSTIKHFKVGRTTIWSKDDDGEVHNQPAVEIPYLVKDKVPLTKSRNLETDKKLREFRRSPGAPSILFNGEAIRDYESVVLVEGEFDAMSLWQERVSNCASTSTGAKKTIPDEWLENLQHAEDIVLWYDDDEQGHTASEALIQQLGSYRCRIARIPEDLSTIGIDSEKLAAFGKLPTDANDLLRLGVTHDGFKKIIDDAEYFDNGNIVESSHFADALRKIIEGEDSHMGIPYSYGVIMELLKGIRPELTVITGHTGHGKSTWALDFLLALLKQTGAPILLTSYENGPLALARKMFQQLFKRPLSSIKNDQDRADALEMLQAFSALRDVWVVDKYGDSHLDDVCENIREAVVRHGVKAVLLDHLEFILPPPSNLVKGTDLINITLKRLLKLSHDLGVAIFVVVHPNGDIKEDALPTGDNAKGSSGIKQLAENGITVYRHRPVYGSDLSRKEVVLKGPNGPIRVELGPNDCYAHLWKKRHDEADEGGGTYIFDRMSLSYSDPHATVAEAEVEEEMELPYDDDYNW